MDFVVNVVAIKIETKISFSFLVPRYFVLCLQDCEEVVGVNFAKVCGAKVVNAEWESDWTPGVCPQTGGAFALVVSFFFEALL